MNIQKVAVIGHPISHTMSPFIHKRLFELSGISCDYRVMDIPELASEKATLSALDGFNVTIPHKLGIIPLLDFLDSKAKLFGSVNTVRVEGGQMTGYTTDGAGCYKALQCHGRDFSGNLLLLGTGGAARALAFEAMDREDSLRLTIACREGSLQKAEMLAGELRQMKKSCKISILDYAQLEAQREESYSLLLNATSVGMYPRADACPVSEQVISRCACVFDAVYNPGETLLLQRAKKLSIPVIPGMEMLVHQAVAAHEIWYGTKFDEEKLAQLCVDAQEETSRIFGGNR